jgi:deoxyhypusine monooxygenase
MESAEVAASSTFGPTPEMEKFLCDLLLDTAQPIAERFRALFSLRNLHGDGPRCALLQGLTSLTHPLISMIKLVV